MSDIDKEFKDVVNQINAKLAEAAASLKEANRLAQEAGIPALIDSQFVRENLSDEDEEETFEAVIDYIDVSALEHELDTAGWSTSSSYC